MSKHTKLPDSIFAIREFSYNYSSVLNIFDDLCNCVFLIAYGYI